MGSFSTGFYMNLEKEEKDYFFPTNISDSLSKKNPLLIFYVLYLDVLPSASKLLPEKKSDGLKSDYDPRKLITESCQIHGCLAVY